MSPICCLLNLASHFDEVCKYPALHGGLILQGLINFQMANLKSVIGKDLAHAMPIAFAREGAHTKNFINKYRTTMGRFGGSCMPFLFAR